MKIIIVGAGPVGCYTARLLKGKRSDIEITLIEEHPEIGKPVHCAGLVSKEVLSEIKIPLSKDVVLNRIDGAEIFLNGNSFKIRRKHVAVVIDRQKFDSELGKGLNISFNTRFIGIEKEGSGYLVETEEGEFYADIVIGSDGANSTLRNIAGFQEDIKYLRGVQFRMKYSKCERNFVQVYLKNQFFAWIIPEVDDIVRVGIISNNPYHDLLEFVKDREETPEILEKFAGIVPLGSCVTQNGNIFLVGDAACQIKPLTYGGIYYGMRCAEILVDCIASDAPAEYERRWKQNFFAEIDAGLKMRKIYECLSPDNVEKIFALLRKNASFLEKFGDFENHSKTISLLFKSSYLPRFLGKILLGIARDAHI